MRTQSPSTTPVAAQASGEGVSRIATDVDPDAPAPGEETAALEAQEDEGSPYDDEVEGEEQAPAPHDDLEVTLPEPTPEQIEHEQDVAEEQLPTFDIPIVVNDKVTAYVDYFSGPHKEKFTASLVRSGRYVEMARRAFDEAGLPKDLVYMAHVESAFKPRAYSRAKAKGMFQFIAATGRRYGLHADNWVDERSDPEKSARAAAAYLSDLHAEFGDWYLALAAYNAGEGKIRRAIARTGSTDFWTIARTSAIRTETKNYVPAILAATLISKDPSAYGFEFTPDPPLAFDVVHVRGGVDLTALAKGAGLDPETIRDLNPEFRRGSTPPGKTTPVRVPPGMGDATLAAADKVPAIRVADSSRHVVRKGDTLGAISKRYGVSVASIQRANKLGSRTTLKVGRVLTIPVSGSVASWPADSDESPRTGSAPIAYRVRSGDTLSSIARRHGTTATAIASASGIGVNRTLRVGDVLRIPAGASAARSRTSRSNVIHTVRRGETLSLIAARYQTSVDRLCDLNDLSRSETIYPGTRLTIR
jgi:membrane-bound lytic murein transglycosylase D